MTIKEAFAQAFDEAFVMDAMPGNDMPKNTLPQKPNAPSGLKKNAAAAPGANPTSGGDKSLSQHIQEGCEATKNGHPERCPYIKKMAKELEQSQGLDPTTAMQQAIGMHTAEAAKFGQGGAQPQEGMEPQPQSPEMLEQQAQQIAQNPQMMEQIPSEMLPETKMVQTEAGELPAQTTVQEGILENLTEQAASGNTLAEESLQELKDKVEDGTITSSPQEETAAAIKKGFEAFGDGIHEAAEARLKEKGRSVDFKKDGAGANLFKEQHPDYVEVDHGDGTVHFEPSQKEIGGESGQIGESAAQVETITTSDGKSSRNIEPDEALVLAANPEKKEIFQKMVDLEGMVGDLKDDSPEFKDLANQYQALQRMFFGDEGMSDVSSESSASEEVKETPLESESPTPPSPPADGSGEGGGGGEGGDGSEPPSETPPTTPPSETPPTTPPNNNKGGAPAHQGTPTPSDSEFQVGKDKYQVGGTVYTDVSGKGLLRTMLSSFMAGLRGEGIITGWDRISGAWDQMKRSENGEMVRDGISGALIKNTIANYAAKEGLPDDAKMELAVIQDMISQAKSPKDNMAAVKQFQVWKEKYSKELGEMDKPKLGEPFKPLPNDYKGGKPPISILDPPKDFDADKAFGDQVASVLQESLGAQGLPVGDIESISVGPSATTIEFKVDPAFDITAANSKKVKESLKGALGTPVSKIEYAAGKPHVVAVQVTNLKMRDVSFSSCIASDEWKDFADKAGLPVTLGKDSSGKNVNLDLAKQPHTIVTGESGSGKSVFLMAAINSLEMAKTPDEARLVLLDPKNEFRSQDGSPHLLYPRAQKPQDIAKYKGKYDEGWDVLRQRRYQRMQELGLISPDETPVASNASGRKWADEPDKAFQSANMEVHAAMIDCVDQNIGRIIDELKRRGIYDNTGQEITG